MNQLQSYIMSGAARFEHQRIDCENSGASRSSMATDNVRHSPMNTGILNEKRQAAGQRIVIVLAEQFLLGLGAGLGVVLVLFLDLLISGCNSCIFFIPIACLRLMGNMQPRTKRVKRTMASP